MTKTEQKIPAVGTVINKPALQPLIEAYGRESVTYAVRKVIDTYRASSQKEDTLGIPEIVSEVTAIIVNIAEPSLKPVINATGIVLHTNLGRAPLGNTVLEDIAPIVSGYSNVEFNLKGGCRGHRNEHIAELLRYITGAEDAIVVNNNAAAIILTLHTFAKFKEVIISRGELIEIGGSFRIPDIMRASGVKMVEVGTTNKTRLTDYENALTKKTACIFRAHRSNFTMSGFTEEVPLKELTKFSQGHGLTFIFDLGSGLLRKPANLPLEQEPDVRSVVASGIDLVTFSCDKLLGGPQGGIIAGKRELVEKCAKNPLMRALRVGKLTISALISACRSYLSDETLVKNNPTFTMLEQDTNVLSRRAEKLRNALSQYDIVSETVPGTARVGGGTLPDLKLDSLAVKLVSPSQEKKKKQTFAEEIFYKLVQGERPIVAVLREGNLVFEIYTVSDGAIPEIALAVKEALVP